MDDLIKEFLVESYENLDQLDRDFVALESDPTAREKISSIFRTIHTIKGTCGCLGFGKLERVAHVGENLLSRLREGELKFDTDITTGLLKLVDVIREILQFIEITNEEGNGDYSAVCQNLVLLNARPSLQKKTASKPAGDASAVEALAAELMSQSSGPAHGGTAPIKTAGGAAAALAVNSTPLAAVAEQATDAHPDENHDAAQHPVSDDSSFAGPERRAAGNAESISHNGIRVDVGLLDKLMNLVGELVLARNQILQFNSGKQDVTFVRTAQRLNLITTELQEGVMKTRMQPIGNLWNKFPRVVRDVASACGKKVRLEMDGVETELDKTIIEAIKDPLTHVIRNSVDHGVEIPEKRRAAGKDEEGRLFMRAFHEGGQVNIEVSDDGKGVDPDVIKRKAVEKGLLTADQAARISDREAVNLIFLPGFSTAEKVTNVSGRGVGMDVVKTNIEKIGGTVEVQSRLGNGTTLRIKIPLTLAIIPALVVTSAGERFAIPQVSLLELVRIERGDTALQTIDGTPLYRLRGNLLPLVYINQELKLANTADVIGSANIVVLRAGERQFGLVVDQINDTEEIVVKPLAKQLKGISVFAGATIMGDGKVALILDVMGIAHRANIMSARAENTLVKAADHAKSDHADRQQLLLIKLMGDHRVAIPLSAVSRLEEFPRTCIEDAGGQPVVQYRGKIMPLINVAEMLGNRRAKARLARVQKSKIKTESIQVVVFAQDARFVGLLVEQILDIVHERVALEKAGVRPGVTGTAIIKDKVTELLDVTAVVQSAATFEMRVAA